MSRDTQAAFELVNVQTVHEDRVPAVSLIDNEDAGIKTYLNLVACNKCWTYEADKETRITRKKSAGCCIWQRW